MHYWTIINNYIVQFWTFYFTHKLLNITIQLMKHINKLSISLFTTKKFFANVFILRDGFKLTKFYIIEFHQNTTNILSNVSQT